MFCFGCDLGCRPHGRDECPSVKCYLFECQFSWSMLRKRFNEWVDGVRRVLRDIDGVDDML
jgi:hypothetical protein